MGIKDFFMRDGRRTDSEEQNDQNKEATLSASSVDDTAPRSVDSGGSSKDALPQVEEDDESEDESTEERAPRFDNAEEDDDSLAGNFAPHPGEETPQVEEAPEEEEREVPMQRGRIPSFNTPQELLVATLPARAACVDQKLRSNLVGSVLVHLRDSGEKFLFDWSTEDIKSEKVTTVATEGEGAPDCTIHLSGTNLMKIASGDLNPQVAMLSDKVKVEGVVGLGIYFFNLIAPRSHVR